MKTKGKYSYILTLVSMFFGLLLGDVCGQSIDYSLVIEKTKAPKEGARRPFFGPVSLFSLVAGETSYSGQNTTLEVTTPQSYIPPIYNTSIPVQSDNATFYFGRQNNRSNMRVGLRLLSFIEGGAVFDGNKGAQFKVTTPQDNLYSGEYQTYWGGYGIGDYAAIGEMSVENKRKGIGWYAQLQIPDINLTRQLAIQPFAFTSSTEAEYNVHFLSGYHRFEKAFNPGYKGIDFKLGNVKRTSTRIGLLFKYRLDEILLFGIGVYSENEKNEFSPNAEVGSFKVKYDVPPEDKTKIGGVLQFVIDL